jgi:hypothetical protein
VDHRAIISTHANKQELSSPIQHPITHELFSF